MDCRNRCLQLLLPWLAGAAAALASPAGAAGVRGDGATLATVGGEPLTVQDLDAEISATLAAGQSREGLTKADPDAVLKRLVQDRLLEQEGYRTGADKLPEIRSQVRDLLRARAVRALMDSVSAPPPGKTTPRPDSLLGRTSVVRRYSHILVPDEAVARTLRDSLDRGVPFADLARRHSTDTTAPSGGDLGFTAEDAYIEEFEAAASKLKLNGIAGPVHSKFGWHLITLTATRTDTLKSAPMVTAVLEAKERQRRTEAVRAYVQRLRVKYAVTTDDSLLARLDYASKDPAKQKELQTSTAVLAVIPTGKLTVAGLTRNIRFKYFHGLEDKPDAAAIRNGMFDEWVTEAVLSHEAHRLGLDRRPSVEREGKVEERRLLREEVLKNILDFPFKPAEAEILAFYQGHQKELETKPRAKVQSVLFEDEAAAKQFGDQLGAGARFSWLVDRTKGIKGGPPPIPDSWIGLDKLGLAGKPVGEGTVVGPLKIPNGWAVGAVVSVAKAGAPPLGECRDQVLQLMRGERNRQVIQESLDQLWKSSGVNIATTAGSTVADRLAYWSRAAAERSRP
jgi:peptidyl-prolyl cis-trans isomerase C